jgi:hypothetical protein
MKCNLPGILVEIEAWVEALRSFVLFEQIRKGILV